MFKIKNKIVNNNTGYYPAIIFLYIAIKYLSSSFVVNFSSIAFPLDTLYMTSLLFNGLDLDISDAIRSTVVSPSSSLFIYPPGIYYITELLGNVGNIFFFLFIWQMFVPILVFKVVSKFTDDTSAFFFSIFSAFYLTSANWWTPDFIIQPLMLLAVYFVIADSKLSLKNIFIVAMLSSLIFVLKHNIGVFFCILVGVVIFFDSMTEKICYKNEKIALVVIVIGFICFGFIFFSKLIYFNEVVFYLLPYFSFIGLTAYVVRENGYGLDLQRFFTHAIVYSVVTLALPIFVFYIIGSKFGYINYWHSLFGMGLSYLHIWDHGILGIINNQIDFSSIKGIFSSASKAILFLTPMVVNFAAVVYLYVKVKNGTWIFSDAKNILKIISIGIMGVFMFFPLEGYHILSTKLFLFLLVAAYLVRQSFFYKKAIVVLMGILLIPAIGGFFVSIYNYINTEKSFGGPELRRIVSIPMEKNLTSELSTQINVIKNYIGTNGFYTIDSSGATLIGLSALVDNPFKQYYIEMRPGILDDDSVNAIVREMDSVDFLIIKKSDYDLYRAQLIKDKYFKAIVKYAYSNFEIIGNYTKVATNTPSTQQIYDFYVLKKSNLH